jgi:hypothetical protein
MSSGPHIITIEEQFEAFFVWNWAISQGIIAPSENRLQHFSRRPQMNAPRLEVDPSTVSFVPEDSYSNTCANVRNDTFIVAAAYQGLISHCTWVKPKHRKTAQPYTTYIYPALETQNYPICHTSPPNDGETKRYAKLEFVQADAGQAYNVGDQSLINISLDYFACHRRPKVPIGEIEITKTSYEELKNNPHHILRLGFGAAVTTFEREDRFYLSFYDFKHPVWERWIPPLEQVPKLVEDFFAVHMSSIRKCSVLTLTRSEKSGHTPSEYLEVIEESLREQLESLEQSNYYSLEELK